MTTANPKRLAPPFIGGLPLPSPPLSRAVERAPEEITPSSRARDAARLAGWFAAYFDLLWRLAARLGVPPAQVDDVVQEAFITADKRASELAPGSERRFLVSTTVKLAANTRRRQQTRQQYLATWAAAAEEPANAEQLLQQKELRLALDVALDELPDEQRQVLVLYELEDYALAEIAELLDIPQGTVASRLGRARAKFAKAAERLRARSWADDERARQRGTHE